MEDIQVMPQSIEAEQAVLGCIINNSSKLDEIEMYIDKNDFYLDKHKCLFKAIKELVAEDHSVDLITLLEELKCTDKLQEAGGVSYITELSSSGIYSNAIDYAKIVKDKSDRRKLIRTGRDLITKSFEDKEINQVLEYVEDSIYSVSNSKDSSQVVDIGQALEDVLLSIESNYKNGGKILGATTGFLEIDKTISGLQKGDFIIVAARPSMGKTAFALNIGQYASKDSSVAIFSLEMTKRQLMERLLAAKCLVDYSSLKTGNLNDKQFEKIGMAIGDLSNRKISIDDDSTSLNDIKAKCRYLKARKGLDVVIIDYLQLIESTGNSYSREQEIAKISRELKKLAKKLEITIIALSQLSRAPEQRLDHRPLLSDLRESGSIEQDADIIMMLYRDEYYNKDSEDHNLAEVIINKNRNGEVKTIKLGWLGQYQRFAPLERV